MIWEIYNDVYQLKRLPPTCAPEWAKELAQEIVTSLEEHLWQRQEGGQEWCHIRASIPYHPAEIPQRTQQREDDSCDQAALAKAREAHQWALVAVHLLKERIERLSQLATRVQSSNHWHSHSCSHSRRWSWGCERRCTNTLAGGEHSMILRGRWAQSPSPSPTRPKKHVTFWDQAAETSSRKSLWGSSWGKQLLENWRSTT